MANVYHVRQLDEGTYAIEEKTPINQGLCYLLCGTRQALLIDTGLGYPGLKKTVEGLTKLPVVVANTHAHVDHIGGIHVGHFDGGDAGGGKDAGGRIDKETTET